MRNKLEELLKSLQISPYAELYDFFENEQRSLLLLVINALTDKWDEIENHDPDTSTEKWKSYKRIRNNIRDTIKEIAESKGIKIL